MFESCKHIFLLFVCLLSFNIHDTIFDVNASCCDTVKTCLSAHLVDSDVWSVYGPQAVDDCLCLILQSMEFSCVLWQQEAEWLEAGLQWARLQRKVVGMLHDALQSTLPHRNPEEVGQPEQLSLDGVSVFQFIVADYQQWVSALNVAFVSHCPLPAFLYCKLRPLFTCRGIT